MKKILFFLTLSTFSGTGLAFATQVFLARTLPQAEFGAFFSALSLIMLISPLGGFGVSALMLKVFGEEGWGAVRWLRPALNFIFFSSIFSLIIIYSLILFFVRDPLNEKILHIITLVLISQVVLEYTSTIFQLEKKYNKLALFQFSPHAIRFLLTILAWLAYGNKINVFIISKIYLITAIITITIGWIVIKRTAQGNLVLMGHKKCHQFLANQEKPSILKILKESSPFGASGFLYLIYFQGGVVLTQYILGNNAAAQYSAAITIMSGIHLIPAIIYQKLLLPNIHIWANHDKEKLKSMYYYGNIVMASIGIIITLALIITASPVINLLFGDGFAKTSEILKTLSLSIPFTFIANNFGAILTTKNSIHYKIYCMGMASIISMIVGFILISKNGIMGAAYTAILVEFFLLCTYFFIIKTRYSYLYLIHK